MLILIRHGHTTMNTAGEERLRGDLPVPLTVEGMRASRETAQTLCLVEGVSALLTSPLIRTVQTAEEIGYALGIMITPEPALRDWNTGFTGQPVKDTLPQIHALMDDPTRSVPGGEPYRAFLDRAWPLLDSLVRSDTLTVAVTHNRVITLAAALAATAGSFPDRTVLRQRGPVDPAGFLIISSRWAIVFQTPTATKGDS